ncbi:MAG TPA: hypothetical protein DET46_17635 [Comamonadaceae bacterium]|nr:MAG: hypothetical protein A3F76_01950 [Burkholderiales bacterium RIFCSPLOWO2_12_FULL_65_40]HCE30252.1 hypothetical protein [Comamonadaceae bacterium]
MTPHFLTRTLALGAVALLATGCVSTGDPYYNDPPPYYRGYESGVMYPPGAYPVYPVAPPPAQWRHTDRERWERENRIYERDRDRWQREHDRTRVERERERDLNARRERELREQNARRDRDAGVREMREREEARRLQAERERRNRTAPDGGPRRDYDRYNPSTGQWLPKSEDLP